MFPNKANFPATESRDLFYFQQNKKKREPTEINRRLIYECLCDVRLKAKAEGSTRLTYTIESGTQFYSPDHEFLWNKIS